MRQNANVHIRRWLSWSLFVETGIATAKLSTNNGTTGQIGRVMWIPSELVSLQLKIGNVVMRKANTILSCSSPDTCRRGRVQKQWSTAHRAGRALALYGRSAAHSSGQPQPSNTCAEKSSCQERPLRSYGIQKAYLSRRDERILLTNVT